MLDQSLLKKLVKYNPKTGKFIRVAKLTKQHNVFPCEHFTPKSITPYGYYQISIMGRPYPLHRLIFLYMTGKFPAQDVDHINGNRLDNRWTNLRQVTRQENLKNIGIRSTNSTGHIGVHHRTDTGKFHAYIHHQGIKHSLGDHFKIEDAIKARTEAEKKYDFHCNHGKRKAWKK